LPVVLSTACVSKKAFREALYFKDSVTEAEKTIAANPVLIMPGDRLNINISAVNKEAADAFNISGGAAATPAGITGYPVDSVGNIQLLQLGTIHVAGLTTARLQDTLQQQLESYIKGPLVTVTITNFKINMMGEIATPGTLTVPDGNISILQAITQAGDLKADARRDNILVIREINGKREFGRVDISSNHVFESPYYYLKQNDIVYIEPDRKKYQTNDAQMGRIIRNYSFGAAVLTTVILLVNLFK
jgi:polysaccharide export outer membrane protein